MKEKWHHTTVLAVRKDGVVAIGSDGQVTLGSSVIKHGASKVRRIAGGKVPVLVEVQAPNRRAWQVTKDLKSFWNSGYTQMRKDLAGRYPKHPWPEDPKASGN